MNALTHVGAMADGVAGFGLDPAFSATLSRVLAACRQAGFEFRVSNGLRTPQVQAEYYCKWNGHSRALIDSKVALLQQNGAPWLASVLQRYREIKQTKAKLTGQLPGSGWHQWGLAADAYCFRNGRMVEDGNDPCYKFYAGQAAALGLRAGYYFKSKDSGHLQGPGADGADEIYTWPYIDRIMMERFSEKTAIAVSGSDKPQTFGFLAGSAESLVGPARRASAKPRRSAAMTTAISSAPPSIPPPATKPDISVRGGKVYGPGGVVFGRISGPGLINIGVTKIDDFFKQDPQAFPGAPACRINVIRAVSVNEGRIEAINTYDNSFLSCGAFQWTAGAGTALGELPGLLALLKSRSPAAFKTYFGDLGLDIEVATSRPGALSVGCFVLNGDKLDTAAKKNVLRDHLWAYRFWRAAHDTDVRRAQVALAMDRVDLFYDVSVTGKKGLTLKDYISSEYGVALLLDQHVNRPGHVPKTLMTGIADFVSNGGARNPAQWTDDDEGKVLLAYLAARAKTNMTDSQMRADAILAQVAAGRLSAKRGSFIG
jgi:hypothetical protein